jgi:hypothetical protein
LGLPTAAPGHNGAAQIQHAALPAVRAELPQHSGESGREGPLVRSARKEDVCRGAAFTVKVVYVVCVVVVVTPLPIILDYHHNKALHLIITFSTPERAAVESCPVPDPISTSPTRNTQTIPVSPKLVDTAY